jgi:hypothetical protein
MRALACSWALVIVAGCSGPTAEIDAAVDARSTSDAAGLDVGPLADTGPLPDTGPPMDTGPTDAAVLPATSCAAFAASTGTLVDVDATMSDALPGLVRDAAPGTTFRLADGTYTMTGDEAARRIQVRATGITIRSASGNAAAVVIDGEYTTAEVIGVYASDFTLAEVTVTHAVDHCVHVTPPDGGPDVTGAHFYGVHFADCGEQFLKVNPGGARDAFVDDGLVECSTFTMTDAGRPHVERTPGGCYTGGIDAHSARGWIVRQNVFRDIYCAGEGLAEHAIHFWVGSRDTVVERNVILDCARGIGFGLVETGVTRDYPDDPFPGLFVGHFGGIIRNNVIVATIPYYDTGIELDQARGAVVLHNTILETDTATGRYSSIDARFENTDVTIVNNLVRRLTVRDLAVTASDHNLEDVPLDYVVDAAGGDAHLTASAAMAIDQGVSRGESGLDIDGEAHDHGAPDLGADER